MTTSEQAKSTSPTRSGTSREPETNVLDALAGTAGELSARLPEVVRSTQDAVDEATRAVRSGSDETLQLVGTMSVGIAVGLLVGGANRLIVLASLVPAALIGATLMGRASPGDTIRPVQGR